ncbi:PAP/fibrillin family protein [Synechococcus sp. PCC 7336]|uniref:PAP/fibrillin family protein n=1 Tax=Synechococcus sp. PCC 7336 TaxID=195250 RepID=UPI00034D4D73|nr:PAP/fibrillin family protein [Synechococcus sp. PCC 7336]
MPHPEDSSPDRAAAKSALLEAIAAAPAPSGLPEPSAEIDRLVAALEAFNPTAAPTAAAELLSGNWRTLYTTSSELLRLGKTLPGFKSRGIYQCIWAKRQLLCNVGEINGLPGLGGIVAVRATFQVVSDRRVSVKFLQAMVGSQAVMNYDLDSFLALMQHRPQQIPAVKVTFPERREQRGWLDITYLDRNLRIGRGNQGNLFVLDRKPPET